MRFRKKPVVVEAMQYHPGQKLPDGVLLGCVECGNPLAFVPHVHTLEGTMTVSPGDWVITGTKGEHYPCKPDVFAEIYEQVAEYEACANCPHWKHLHEDRGDGVLTTPAGCPGYTPA